MNPEEMKEIEDCLSGNNPNKRRLDSEDLEGVLSESDQTEKVQQPSPSPSPEPKPNPRKRKFEAVEEAKKGRRLKFDAKKSKAKAKERVRFISHGIVTGQI